MKTIAVSKRSTTIMELLQKASREDLILRTPEGNEFILAEIDDFEGEIRLTRKNKRLMKLLDARGRQTPTMSLAQAKARLGLTK
jgi:hypothetical protein